MKKILRCKITLEIEQEIELNEEDYLKVEEYLKNKRSVSMYISNGSGLIVNPIYDILDYEMDLDLAADSEINDIELEDIED